MERDGLRVGRHPERAHYDAATIAEIFDRALICHVGFVTDTGQPIVLPTIHARIDRTLYLHGSVLARWLKAADGARICISATLVDDIVLARSAFHHSMNYRSAVAIGTAEIVQSLEERSAAFEAIVEHVCPGRWKDVRWPSEPEARATLIVKLPLDRATAKVRTGPPIDAESDMGSDVWAGLWPVRSDRGTPIPDPDLRREIPVPEYLCHLERRCEAERPR